MNVKKDQVRTVHLCELNTQTPLQRTEKTHIWSVRQESLDQTNVADVVLDVEEGRRRSVTHRRLQLLLVDVAFGRCAHGRCNRQLKPERRPGARSAFHAEETTDGFHETFGERETEARSFNASRIRVESIEGCEKPVVKLWRDAGPRVVT